MPEVGRSYIDGGGASRQMLADQNVDGRDSFGSYDRVTHGKLDTLITLTSSNAEVSANEVTINNTITNLIEVDCTDWKTLALSFTNTGGDLTEFEVQTRFHATGQYFTRVSAAVDYTTNPRRKSSGNPASIVIDASQDLTNLPDGTPGWIELDVSTVYSVRLRARTISGTTDISVLGILK